MSKTKALVLLSISSLMSLAACDFNFNIPIPDPDKPSEPDTPTNPDTPDTPDTPDQPGDTTKINLNAYGDYVELENTNSDINLQEKYNELKVEQKGEINGVLQSNYEKGLLEFFNLDNKVRVQIDISKDELNKLDNDYYTKNRESFRECKLDIYMLGLHFHYEGVGIRQKGNTSRGAILNGNKLNLRHYKLSFEETFDDEFTETPKTWQDEVAKASRQDRKFFGISKIDFRWNRNLDSTYLREYYAYELYRSNGGLSLRSNPVNFSMKVGDSVENMGVYLAIETANKSFIKRNFVKASRGGDLYKLSWGSGVGARFDSTDSNLFGVETIEKDGNKFRQVGYTYDLKTNKDTSDHSTLKNWITSLNQQHGNTIYEWLQTNSNYDLLIKYLATSYLLGDPDDLRGNYNNTYMYFDGQKAIFIPTDHDRVLGATGNNDADNPTGNKGAEVAPFDFKTGYSYNDQKFIGVTLLSNNSTTVKQDYLNKINEIINNGTFSIQAYQEYYSKVQQNYSTLNSISSNIINPGIPSFGLTESNSLNDKYNLSIATYINKKIETATK